MTYQFTISFSPNCNSQSTSNNKLKGNVETFKPGFYQQRRKSKHNQKNIRSLCQRKHFDLCDRFQRFLIFFPCACIWACSCVAGKNQALVHADVWLQYFAHQHKLKSRIFLLSNLFTWKRFEISAFKFDGWQNAEAMFSL